MAGLAGCSLPFNQDAASIVIVNNHDISHTFAIRVTTQGEDETGGTDYYGGKASVNSGTEHRINNAISHPDYVPDVYVYVVVDTEKKGQNEVAFDFRELRITYTANEQIEIEPVGKV
ncbi:MULTISPECIES: hypothetical protein [unclassified Haladaptatus]|uniref:hypothetical protein n=1 Tax=unclassified Haladaptatus TaxID=2622732 RepID=UPI0023E82D6D|nr:MULTISPECIES: hypothetical protein [unclassified Haladaptatus]